MPNFSEYLIDVKTQTDELRIAATEKSGIDCSSMSISGVAEVVKNISSGITPTGTKKINENGIHDVKEFEFADVDVKPKLQEKTTNVNGDVTPDAGYDGLSKVIVDVPSEEPTLITKEITENGTYNASDDSADGFDGVIVNVAGGGSAEDILKNIGVIGLPYSLTNRYFYHNGVLIVGDSQGTHDKVYMLNGGTGEWEQIADYGIGGNAVTELMPFALPNDKIYIPKNNYGSRNTGVKLVDTNTKEVFELTSLTDMYFDGGRYVLDSQNRLYALSKGKLHTVDYYNNTTTQINMEDGTNYGYINLYNTENYLFLTSNSVSSMLVFNKETQKLTRAYLNASDTRKYFNVSEIDGLGIIASPGSSSYGYGMLLFNEDTGQFENVFDYGYLSQYRFFKTSDGKLFMTLTSTDKTLGSNVGIFMFNRDTRTFEQVVNNPSSPDVLSYYYSFYEDSKGNVFASAQTSTSPVGLLRFSSDTNKFEICFDTSIAKYGFNFAEIRGNVIINSSSKQGYVYRWNNDTLEFENIYAGSGYYGTMYIMDTGEDGVFLSFYSGNGILKLDEETGVLNRIYTGGSRWDKAKRLYDGNLLFYSTQSTSNFLVWDGTKATTPISLYGTSVVNNYDNFSLVSAIYNSESYSGIRLYKDGKWTTVSTGLTYCDFIDNGDSIEIVGKDFAKIVIVDKETGEFEERDELKTTIKFANLNIGGWGFFRTLVASGDYLVPLKYKFGAPPKEAGKAGAEYMSVGDAYVITNKRILYNKLKVK